MYSQESYFLLPKIYVLPRKLFSSTLYLLRLFLISQKQSEILKHLIDIV